MRIVFSTAPASMPPNEDPAIAKPISRWNMAVSKPTPTAITTKHPSARFRFGCRIWYQGSRRESDERPKRPSTGEPNDHRYRDDRSNDSPFDRIDLRHKNGTLSGRTLAITSRRGDLTIGNPRVRRLGCIALFCLNCSGTESQTRGCPASVSAVPSGFRLSEKPRRPIGVPAFLEKPLLSRPEFKGVTWTFGLSFQV